MGRSNRTRPGAWTAAISVIRQPAIARRFHLQLRRRPLKTTVHLRRLLNLVQLYGRADVLAAIALAVGSGTRRWSMGLNREPSSPFGERVDQAKLPAV